jgi:putative Mg2+ transporter-C (MgtC) family protein
MSPMPLTISWNDVALRLACTVIASVAIGYNREERGKAAGMRTTLMVCLAAAVAMTQVNVLLSLAGRPHDSFVMNDLMRLPLGILTGVGFIGGGAILRRSDMVVGVTTAATLWLVTVIGLCFGGGQLALGWTATGLGLAALWGLGRIERRIVRHRTVRLTLECDDGGPSETELLRRLCEAGFEIAAYAVSFEGPAVRRAFVFDLRQSAPATRVATPEIFRALAFERGVLRLQWRVRA